ncbi:MAG: hypothetical protein ACQESD_00505 [Thermoplasmatota archaeon]
MNFAEIISENFLLIFYSIVVIVILAIIAKLLNTREREKTRRELADLNLKNKKLDMLEREKHLDKLKETSMVLKDEEKTKVDEIERDKAILSRRSLALMNEIEERMQRLERGTDNAKLLKTLKDIKKAENELFGNRGE